MTAGIAPARTTPHAISTCRLVPGGPSSPDPLAPARRHPHAPCPARSRLALATLPAAAHHGWGWTDGGEFALTGTVVAADLGNPHGVLTMEVEGESWAVEVGQPWRNAAAGLTDEMLAPGAELPILGERSADPAELLMKAEVVVDGVDHVWRQGSRWPPGPRSWCWDG